MIKDLIVVGAGNPDIVKLIEEINDYKKQFNLIGFLEKDIQLHGQKVLGYYILGNDDLLNNEYSQCAVVNNVLATTMIRESISNNLQTVYNVKEFPNLIHPTLSTKYLELGQGNIIYQNVSIGACVTIGNFNIVYYGSTIGHEAVIGNNNLIAANTLIGARCKLNNRIYISNSSTVSLGLEICDDVIVNVGSVVVNSIRKPKKVFGYPAKELRF